jgi:hypothetical protein
MSNADWWLLGTCFLGALGVVAMVVAIYLARRSR